MEIGLLSTEEWPSIADIVRKEFHAGMPSVVEQSMFMGAVEDRELAGFVQVERIYHVNHLYIAERHRHSHLARDIMQRADQEIPPGFPAMALTDEPGLVRLLLAMGGRDCGTWRLIRKDY